jgi:putative aldouronate transport system permease protein
MILPVLLGFLLLIFVPMFGLVIVFQNYDLVSGFRNSPWVGLSNFAMFFKDPYFLRVVKNTVVLGFLTLVTTFPIPIILALSMNEVRRQHGWFKRVSQTLSYLPHFISVVVVIGLIHEFFGTDGVVNQVLSGLGAGPFRFLGVTNWFRPMYLGSIIWQEMGWSAILYLSALTNISTEDYEAAIMDGANRWQQLIYITLPGILPVISLVLILSVSGIVGTDFQRVLLLQAPITYEVSDVIDTYVYRRGLLGLDFSYGAAVGLLSSVVAFLLVFTTNWIAKHVSEDAEGLW